MTTLVIDATSNEPQSDDERLHRLIAATNWKLFRKQASVGKAELGEGAVVVFLPRSVADDLKNRDPQSLTTFDLDYAYVGRASNAFPMLLKMLPTLEDSLSEATDPDHLVFVFLDDEQGAASHYLLLVRESQLRIGHDG